MKSFFWWYKQHTVSAVVVPGKGKPGSARLTREPLFSVILAGAATMVIPNTALIRVILSEAKDLVG